MDVDAPNHVDNRTAPSKDPAAESQTGRAIIDSPISFGHAPDSQVGAENAGAEHISEGSGRTSSVEFELDDMVSEESLDDDEETGLTAVNRRKRRKRIRRNMALDGSAVVDSKMSTEEKKAARQEVFKKVLINVVLIGLWYLFSILISLYNKWMFGARLLNFPFPLFTTCMHMVVQFTLASLVLYLVPQLRPGQDPNNFLSNRGLPRNEHRATELKNPTMTRWFYLTRIGPCGAATGLDIGLGNMSLRFITLTFYTMCKSSALGFVLMFAFIFRLEKPSWKLTGIIAVMTVGVILMVAGETAFNLFGFVLVMLAALSSGFRWSLTQILLLRNPATSNPISSIFFLAPVMFLSLLMIALPVEGVGNLIAGFRALVEKEGVILGTGILLAPGIIAFLMTTSEFALLQRTSVVTLSVCGIFKEVVTIGAAGIAFSDKLTPINFFGLLVTIASIGAYNYIKIRKMRDETRMKVRDGGTDPEHSYAALSSGETISERDGPTIDDVLARTSTSDVISKDLSVRPLQNEDLGTVETSARVSPTQQSSHLE